MTANAEFWMWSLGLSALGRKHNLESPEAIKDVMDRIDDAKERGASNDLSMFTYALLTKALDYKAEAA